MTIKVYESPDPRSCLPEWKTCTCKPCRSLRGNRISGLKTYGMTLEEYERLFDEQCGHCAICQVEDDWFAVDHDHETGQVRGLLCIGCNLGLGNFGDNVTALAQAIVYLSKLRL